MTSTMSSPAPPKADLTETLRRFREDAEYHARVVLRIQTKDGTMVPFRWKKAQRLLHEKVEAQLREKGCVRAIILKARQLGISTWIAGRIYRGTTLFFNRRALVVADKDDHSIALAEMYERFYENSPQEVRPTSRARRRGAELLFDRPGGGGLGSQIAVDTAGGGQSVGRSLTRWYLHLSEVAFYQRQLDVLISVLQTVPQGKGEVYLESTANGVGDEFHTRYVLAESGASDYIAIFLPWWVQDDEYVVELSPEEKALVLATTDPWERKALDVGIPWEGENWLLDAEQLEWRRRKIRDDFAGDIRAFRQEYPSTAREAFIVSGNAYFDEDALLAYEGKTRPPLYRGNFVEMRSGIALVPAERGYVRVWENPDPDGHYVIAADTASGRLSAARDTSLSDAEAERGGRDFCSADVLKVSELVDDPGDPRKRRKIRTRILRQVAQIHGRMAPEVFAQQIYAASAYWSCTAPGKRRWLAYTAVERNHDSGQTAIRVLRETYRHSKLHYSTKMNVRDGVPTVEVGWKTDAITRMPMLDEFAAVLRSGTAEIFSADTIRECFTFVRNDEGRPEAQLGTHDDRVISFAIAIQMALHHHRDGPSGSIPETPVYETPTGT